MLHIKYSQNIKPFLHLFSPHRLKLGFDSNRQQTVRLGRMRSQGPFNKPLFIIMRDITLLYLSNSLKEEGATNSHLHNICVKHHAAAQ